jgi:hypothetical protein
MDSSRRGREARDSQGAGREREDRERRREREGRDRGREDILRTSAEERYPRVRSFDINARVDLSESEYLHVRGERVREPDPQEPTTRVHVEMGDQENNRRVNVIGDGYGQALYAGRGDQNRGFLYEREYRNDRWQPDRHTVGWVHNDRTYSISTDGFLRNLGLNPGPTERERAVNRAERREANRAARTEQGDGEQRSHRRRERRARQEGDGD